MKVACLLGSGSVLDESSRRLVDYTNTCFAIALALLPCARSATVGGLHGERNVIMLRA